MLDFSRRGFIGGLIGVVAAPAIVRYANIMPVKVMRDDVGAFYFELEFNDGRVVKLPYVPVWDVNGGYDFTLRARDEVTWPVDRSGVINTVRMHGEHPFDSERKMCRTIMGLDLTSVVPSDFIQLRS